MIAGATGFLSLPMNKLSEVNYNIKALLHKNERFYRLLGSLVVD
jgi:hypothetical protein